MSAIICILLQLSILAYAIVGGVFLAFSDFIMRSLAHTGGTVSPVHGAFRATDGRRGVHSRSALEGDDCQCEQELDSHDRALEPSQIKAQTME